MDLNFDINDLIDLNQKYQDMMNNAATSISKNIVELIKEGIELNINEIVKEAEKEMETIIPSDSELFKNLKEVLTADIIRSITVQFDLEGKI